MSFDEEFRALCERHGRTDLLTLLDTATPLAQDKMSIIERQSPATYYRILKPAVALAIAVWGADDAWKA